MKWLRTQFTPRIPGTAAVFQVQLQLVGVLPCGPSCSASTVQLGRRDVCRKCGRLVLFVVCVPFLGRRRLLLSLSVFLHTHFRACLPCYALGSVGRVVSGILVGNLGGFSTLRTPPLTFLSVFHHPKKFRVQICACNCYA